MPHTARDNFRDWYVNGVKKEIATEEFSKRRHAVEELLENEDVDFWIGLMETYFGDYESSSEEYENLIKVFKKHDDLFSLTNNYVFRLLLGCTLAEKIEQQNAILTNFIALAILIRQPFIDEVILQDLTKVAHNQILKNALYTRKEIFTAKPKAIDISGLKVEVPDLDADESEDGAQQFNIEFAKKYNELLDITSDLAEQNVLYYSKNQALAEECEILWWLFTGYSELANKLVKDVSLTALSILGPLELANLTRILPVITNSNGFILALFDKAGHNLQTENTLTSIIASIAPYRETIIKLLPSADPKLDKYCLLSTGIRHFLTYSEIEWQYVFNQVYKLDLSQSVSSMTIATQFYQELMLAKLFKALTENGK